MGIGIFLSDSRRTVTEETIKQSIENQDNVRDLWSIQNNKGLSLTRNLEHGLLNRL